MSRSLPPLLALAVVAAPAAGRAQSPVALGVGVLYVGVPAVGALACDLGVAVGMSTEGTARKGFVIAGLVFSGVDLLASSLFLEIGVSSGSAAVLGVAGGLLAFGVGSAALCVYGLLHLRPPPPEEPEATRPPKVRVLPFASSERGRTSAGLALAARW